MSRSTANAQLRKIIVLEDGSDNAKRAEGIALNVAKNTAAEVLIVNVVAGHANMGVPEAMSGEFIAEYYEGMESQGQKVLKSALDDAKSAGVSVSGRVIRAKGGVVEAAVDVATKEKADLIVMGTRGMGGFKRMVMGSVASGVINHAPCSVLVVR